MAATSRPALENPPLRKTERTRLRLVEAVRQQIEAGGGFTAEQAARRAGASPATFYNHFGSKDDALAAAFAALMDDLVEHVAAHLRVDRLLELGLEAFAADWILDTARFFRAHTNTFRAAQTELPKKPSLRAIYRERETAALAHYERFMRLGQSARVLRSGDAGAIALAFMIANQGWHHPTVLRMQPGDDLHRELTRSVVLQLAPGAAQA